MGKPIVNSTARRPGVVDRDTEEALRVLENRLANLENAVANETQVDDFDDSVILNNIKNLYRQIDVLRKKPGISPGDVYSSYFDLSYSGTGSDIDVADGYLRWPIYIPVVSESVTIDTLVNGTHYIYLTIFFDGSSNTWLPVYGEATTIADDPVDEYTFVIGQVTVSGNAINKNTIIQHKFGMIELPAAQLEVRYTGDFAAFATFILGEVYVSPGVIISGENFISSGDETIAVGVTAGTKYVYYEVDGSLTATLQTSAVYPTNTSSLTRFLVATVIADGSDLTEIIQSIHGQFHISNNIGVDTPLFLISRDSDTTFSIGAGRVVHGTGSDATAADTGVTISVGDGVHYVFIEMSDSTGWTYSLDESTTYPTQTDTFEYVVLGTITVASSIITGVQQWQSGEIHSTRIWD